MEEMLKQIVNIKCEICKTRILSDQFIEFWTERFNYLIKTNVENDVYNKIFKELGSCASCWEELILFDAPIRKGRLKVFLQNSK